MKSDEISWDERYKNDNHPSRPSEIVVRFAKMARVGRALDIAAGGGRNSVYLSSLGFQVDAVDISAVGLGSINTQGLPIHTIQADLDTYPVKSNTYSLIININFLDRHLFEPIAKGLKPGGILVFQTFLNTTSDIDFKLTPHSHYLSPNELLSAFSSLRVLHYDETYVREWRGNKREMATLVASKLEK